MTKQLEPLHQVAAEDFFDRARARLTLEVPPALTDPMAEGARGDLDLNPSMWERAGVAATKPAAVLVPVIERSEPTVLFTIRTQQLASHAGQVAFPGGKIDPGDGTPGRRRAARGEGRDRSCAVADRAARLSRSLSDFFRLSHSADGGSRQARLCADAQSVGGHRDLRGAARFPDDAGQRAAPKLASGKASCANITRYLSAIVTFGASRQVLCAISTIGSGHDQAVRHRDRTLSRSVSAVRRISCGDAHRESCSPMRGRYAASPGWSLFRSRSWLEALSCWRNSPARRQARLMCRRTSRTANSCRGRRADARAASA